MASTEGRVRCDICPHACELVEGKRGVCRARVLRDGRVVDENYGRVTSIALDPVEKKPLARWNPGSYVLSVGSYGCNMRCPFCQNASIACAGEADAPWREYSPSDLVETALRQREHGCVGVAYTYNEPLIGYEFVRDTARLAHEAGLANVVVSNGLINEVPLRALLGLIDAANIDLKAFDAGSYRSLGGDFDAVKRTIELLSMDDVCHVEVTTLVVSGFNDSEATIEEAARWLASLDPAIPYHLTRFFPCHYLADRPPTPIATIDHLVEVASRHMRTVLRGNCGL